MVRQTESVGGSESGVDREAIASLSKREVQVLSLAAAGLLDKQISGELGVSLNTLRTYWTRIRTKMGEVSRSALAVAYVEQFTKEDDLAPDWEIDLQERVWRKISDRQLLIDAPIGTEFTLDRMLGFFHPDDAPRIERLIESIMYDQTEAFTYQGRLVLEDGTERNTGAYIRVVRDRAGVATKLIGRYAPTFDLRGDHNDYPGRIRHQGWVYHTQTGLLLASDGINEEHGLKCGVPHPRSAYSRMFFAEDYVKGLVIMDDIAAGKYESASFRLRTIESGGREEVGIAVHGVRDAKGDVTKVIGYRTRLQHVESRDPAQLPKLHVGFWAKDLRSDTFIVPDEEFCRIYRVDRRSPTLDQDIRSRYRPEEADAAYDFIETAVESGRDRGSKRFTLVFEDLGEQPITLEFFVERENGVANRMNGTVLAYTF